MDFGADEGHCDHIAMYAGDEQQIAASSSHEEVVQQPVDWAHEVKLGYVPQVTGEH